MLLRVALPFLVVISMTPLPKRRPYQASEAASFSTVMLSISLMSMSLNGRITPSTSVRREFGPNVDKPRVWKKAPSKPGAVPVCCTYKPGMRPANVALAEATGIWGRLRVLNVEMAMLTSRFLRVPNGIGTTSSSPASVRARGRAARKPVTSPSVFVCPRYPFFRITSTSPGAA